MTFSDQDDDTLSDCNISGEFAPFPYLLCLSEEGKAATPLRRRHQKKTADLGKGISPKNNSWSRGEKSHYFLLFLSVLFGLFFFLSPLAFLPSFFLSLPQPLIIQDSFSFVRSWGGRKNDGSKERERDRRSKVTSKKKETLFPSLPSLDNAITSTRFTCWYCSLFLLLSFISPPGEGNDALLLSSSSFFVGGPQDVPLLFLYALDLPAHMQLLAKVSCKNLGGAEATRWKVPNGMLPEITNLL